ncbi:MAG: hypothetical protein JNL80_16880 [Phycisphaerae bacterium]|jgi:hypothetical protein|nr:hypothetical protein [Phycisphaerae bacterium]
MSRLSGSYDLGRATGVCAATGVPLEPGAPCVIALAEVATPEQANAGSPSGMFLRRLEYSIPAWEALAKDGKRPDGLFCFWRTVWSGGQSRKMFVDDETLLDIFQRLDADERPQRQAFRFVLMLFLVRKKLLRVVGTRRDGERESWLVNMRGTDPASPPTSVVNPRLKEDDIREIADQLSEIMQGDLSANLN